jgi:hypothetical protein
VHITLKIGVIEFLEASAKLSSLPIQEREGDGKKTKL